MLRGDLKSSGSDWIVYSSAGFFRFLLGNIASFMPAWLFLWHKSEMTNGTQQYTAVLWVAKGLIKHFISYFLNYICVCIYIRNVTCHVFFCLLFFPDLFLLYPNELKDSFEITLYLYRITHFQLIHSPVFRDDDETHSYCIDERVQKLKLAACLHFWQVYSFADCSVHWTCFE